MTAKRALLAAMLLLAPGAEPALAQGDRSGGREGRAAAAPPRGGAAVHPEPRPPAASRAAAPSRAEAPPRAARPDRPRDGAPAAAPRRGEAARTGASPARPPHRGGDPSPTPRPPAVPPAAALLPPLLAPLPGLSGEAPPPVAPEARERRALAGPFRPAPPAAPGPAMSCEPRLTPVRNLEGFGYYMDPAFSRAEPDRLAMDQAAARPLREWLAQVGRALARHRRGEAGAAACALGAMEHWARNEALLGGFNIQGDYHRAWTLAGASLAFLAIREAPGLEAGRVTRVGRWLSAVGRRLIPRHDRNSEALISDVRNNQAAWAGLAVAAAGVAAGEPEGLEWGVGKLRAQLAQVDARGALPQEVRRGAMALHYHLFALEAVAALERLAAANGLPLTEAERAAYHRLRDFVREAARDPAKMAALAGQPQADPFLAEGAVPLTRGAGLEIAAVAMPDPETEAALAPFRPLAAARLGGAVTGWWRGDAGTPDAPATPPSGAAPSDPPRPAAR